MLRFCLFSLFLHATLALNCTQIPDSQITKGATFYLPGPDHHLQTIPANWNCIYTIKAPTTLTSGYHAHVELSNGLKGVNDYIAVTDITGLSETIRSRDFSSFNYDIIPGSQMTIQVVTKSVLMNSQFSITVDYHAATIGGTVPMKTGGEMNILNTGDMHAGDNSLVTLTYSANEPILILLAADYSKVRSYVNSLYFVDGPITDQSQIFRLDHVAEYSTVTTTNFMTVVAFGPPSVPFVFNLASDAKPFDELSATDITYSSKMFYTNGQVSEAMEMAVFDSKWKGMIMDNLKFTTTPCKARVMSGPPNNSSRLLLDLSKNPPMPHTFNVQYLTVVEDHCDFSYSLKRL